MKVDINMLAIIMKGLLCDDCAINNALEYNTIEELMNDNNWFTRSARTIVELIKLDVLNVSLTEKIQEIHKSKRSCSSIKCIQTGRDTTYLVFDLDFDESHDSLYLDVNTLEIWPSKERFIEYLLSK